MRIFPRGRTRYGDDNGVCCSFLTLHWHHVTKPLARERWMQNPDALMSFFFIYSTKITQFSTIYSWGQQYWGHLKYYVSLHVLKLCTLSLNSFNLNNFPFSRCHRRHFIFDVCIYGSVYSGCKFDCSCRSLMYLQSLHLYWTQDSPSTGTNNNNVTATDFDCICKHKIS